MKPKRVSHGARVVLHASRDVARVVGKAASRRRGVHGTVRRRRRCRAMRSQRRRSRRRSRAVRHRRRREGRHHLPGKARGAGAGPAEPSGDARVRVLPRDAGGDEPACRSAVVRLGVRGEVLRRDVRRYARSRTRPSRFLRRAARVVGPPGRRAEARRRARRRPGRPPRARAGDGRACAARGIRGDRERQQTDRQADRRRRRRRRRGGDRRGVALAWFVRGAGEGSPLAFESARCRAMSALVADAAAAAIADTENARFERFVAADGSDRTRSDDDAREPPRENDRRAKTMARLRAVATRAFCARGVSALATLATRNQLSVVVRSDRPVTSPVTSRDNHSVARPVVDEAATATYDGLAVFPLTCLMNHGCAPNAETRFDDAIVADAATVGAARASPPARASWRCATWRRGRS